METKGIEPSFPRCDRGVLPLHHVPETTIEYAILQERFRNSTYFYAAFGESSELPRIVANYFFYRLAFRLGFAVRRIAENHQLNDDYIFRNSKYLPDFIRIE